MLADLISSLEITTLVAMAKAVKKSTAEAETERILSEVLDEMRWGHFSEMLTIAIPSHDRDSKALEPALRRRWSDKTMKLFADLFEGATALPTTKGIFKSSTKKYLWDETVMVETWAPHGTCSNTAVVGQVVAHAQAMRAELNQEAVMVVFDKIMKFIKGGK